MESLSRKTREAEARPRVVALRQYAVDESLCIGCGLCETRAPENVQLAPGAMSARVVQQPRNADEEQGCAEASEYCPTGGLQPVR